MYNRAVNVKKSERGYYNVLLTVLAAIVMAITILLYFMPKLSFVPSADDKLFFTVLFSLLLLTVGLYFGLKRKESSVTLGFILVMTAAAIAVRLAFLDYQSNDYNHFLKEWIEELQAAPGVQRWKEDLGDYNMPYIYFLTLVAKQSYSPLYSIKYFSIIFDFLLAYFAMQCASIVIKSPKKQIAVFIAVLFWPTAVLNSSYWAQCDSVYTALCLGGLYYGLTKRPNWCVGLFAAAFSFKLQTIFALPILFVLLMTDKIKLKNLAVFPAVFFGVLIPALLAGKPFLDTIMIYANQTGTYRKLTLNAPTIFSLTDKSCDYDQFKLYGIMLAGAAMLLILYFVWLRRENFTDGNIMATAFLFAIAIPFFLPAMHERYFFLADYFAFLAFFVNRKRWFIPLMMVYISFRSYSVYLFGDAEVNFVYLSIMVAAIIGITVYDLIEDIAKREKCLLASQNDRL